MICWCVVVDGLVVSCVCGVVSLGVWFAVCYDVVWCVVCSLWGGEMSHLVWFCLMFGLLRFAFVLCLACGVV